MDINNDLIYDKDHIKTIVKNMPYSKEHKEQTRKKILESAYSLFSTKGFNAVTVDEVMQNCSLTRGAFYAHFKSKPDLYSESLKFAGAHSRLIKEKPKGISSAKWLRKLLDGYLSIEHVKGENPCPLAFLATDIVTRDQVARKAYEHAYKNMNKIIMRYIGTASSCDEKDIFSLTSMIIGAVAVSRTIKDEKLIKNILNSCRKQARQVIGI